jgi:hypothetical protein
MKPEQVQEFIKLLREHFRLRADVKASAAILETAVRFNQTPFGWLEALKVTREEPAYRSISEQFAPQLAELEQSLEASELVRFLESIPPTQFLN